ncbi:DUF6660 family protein [Ferruginibacter sp.]
MKLAALLFSFYLLLLPALPCMDRSECSEARQTTLTAGSAHQQHHHEEEACSPLCSCACCGQVLAPVWPFKATTCKVLFQKQPYFNPDPSFASSYNGTIWQPPRLG